MSTTVLVVEDDREINELIGEYLAIDGIRYIAAESGKAGIHMAMAEKPDAIILDLMLPDIDGFEVARSLTTHRATFDIPIVILSCMCQECDKIKGFGAGALFFMNKPFLPDDLLGTLRRAFEWRASVHERNPAGAITMGGTPAEAQVCSKATQQMVADLFARTDLSDAAVEQIREAIDTLSAWAGQWNAEHAKPSHMKMEYRIFQPENNGVPAMAPAIEWKLQEDVPGILADAFFKPAPPAPSDASAWSVGAGLIGWGNTGVAAKVMAPVPPPAKWLQVLAKTGAARFEKDSKSQTVRFVRPAINGSGASPACGPVPVVEIDGTRYPTRLRDEALAAKRK